MESAWRLIHLLEPFSLALIMTAVLVTFASASRSLSNAKEMERSREISESTITLDHSQALMIPVVSSCSLVLMFYLFASISQLMTAFTAVAAAFSVYFCLSPYVTYVKSQFGLVDPFMSRCCSKSFSRIQGSLVLISVGTVLAWLVSGHWVLNNVLGICICITFVSHVRLPNIKICSLLLVCLFAYDIFWVFFSEKFFGANVMVSVATQQASNPVRTVATSLSLPGFHLITKKLELPVKLIFPRNIFEGVVNGSEYMMLGLGDMAIPSMLLALVLCYEHKKNRDSMNSGDTCNRRGYAWFALTGYAIGLVVALAAGMLTDSAQPALLYLVPSTLGPVIITSWIRKEFMELWDGRQPHATPSERPLNVRTSGNLSI